MKVLHIYCGNPEIANRLQLQLQYASGKWTTEIILRDYELSDYSIPAGCHRIRHLLQRHSVVTSRNSLVRKIQSIVLYVINPVILYIWLARSDADILHAHEHPSLWAASFWTLILRRPAIWDPHDVHHHDEKHRHLVRHCAIKRLLERLLVRQKVKVLVVSKGMKRVYDCAYPSARAIVLQSLPAATNCKSDTIFARSPKSLQELRNSLCNGYIRIVYPGLIRPTRIALDLIDLIAHQKNILFDIYGYDSKGEYEKTLKELLATKQIDNVRIMGPYTPQSIVPILNYYHFAIFPFQLGPLNISICRPNKFYQCILAGLPLIVTDMEELGKTILQNGLGYVFPCGHYEALMAFFETFNTQSAVYERMIQNVISFGQRHMNYEEEKQKLLDLYTHTLK